MNWNRENTSEAGYLNILEIRRDEEITEERIKEAYKAAVKKY